MKLNNKGFAISTVMYMILIMSIVLITLTLSILSARKLILDKIRKETSNNIYNAYNISYRQALEILKEEVIAYGISNNITEESIKISDLNSSIDKEILDGYELSDKYLTIKSNESSYIVYFGKKVNITDITENINNFVDILDYKIYGGSKRSSLPDGYTEVEYLESTGTQYINTGVDVNQTSTINMKFNVVRVSGNNYFFGTRLPSVLGAGNGGSGSNFNFYVGGSIVFRKQLTASILYDMFLDIPNHNVTINQETTNFSAVSTFSSEDVYLFAYNGSGRPTAYAYFQIGETIFTTDGEETLHLIPCLDTNQVPCMYDTVSKQTFYNAGRGTFITGKESVTDVGDHVTDVNDENYGKYKIEISVNGANSSDLEETEESEPTDIYLDKPLRCIEDICDYIDFGNSKVLRNIREEVYDGSENWALDSSQDNLVFTLPLNSDSYYSTSDIYGLNNKGFIVRKGNDQGTSIAIEITNEDGNFDSISDVNDWKNWLSNNNLKITYPLKNSVEEEISLPKIVIYRENNNINVNTSTKPTKVEFSVIQKIRQL